MLSNSTQYMLKNKTIHVTIYVYKQNGYSNESNTGQYELNNFSSLYVYEYTSICLYYILSAHIDNNNNQSI